MPAAGTRPLMVEEEAAHLDECVAPALGRVAAVEPLRRGQAQGRGHQRPALGVEGAVERVAVVEGIGQVDGSVGSGWARSFQADMARATPVTVIGARYGTSSASWAAKVSTSSSSTMVTMASIWPADRTPCVRRGGHR